MKLSGDKDIIQKKKSGILASSKILFSSRNIKNKSAEAIMIKNHNSSILPYNSKTNKYLNDFTNSNNSILNINAFRSNNTSVLKLKQYKLEKNKRRVNSCMKSFRTYNKNNSNIKKEKTTQSLNSLNTI